MVQTRDANRDANRDIAQQVANLAQLLTSNGMWLATAESCTGGLIAAACTALPGSSRWFDRGFVTYSNDAKQQLLGVSADTLNTFGAVSSETVMAMAFGALARSKADIAISVSGIAGPDGGTDAKPVGTVWFGLARKGVAVEARLQRFDGERAAVREQALEYALQWLLDSLR
ncbi:MAG: CinA family protein [Pseudomonadota bacterium]